MRKVSYANLVVLLLVATVLQTLIPAAYSEHLDYDPVANKCIVYPTGGDDTSNLQEAFDTVVAGGLGGEVQLLEGVYTISAPIVVVNFDGWFHGAGKEKTLLENEYTESWPRPDNEAGWTGFSYIFLFYQTNDVPKTLRFSDMSIKIHGWAVEDIDFMNATMIQIFIVLGKVDGDSENLYESEINTVFERMHFEGEIVDAWHTYNMSPIFVSGEPLPNILFKPLSGTHIIDNCTGINAGGVIRYDTMTGHIIVTNNDFRNITFGLWPRNANMPKFGTYFICNNRFTNCRMMDAIMLTRIDNSIIKNNVIDGSLGGGISISGSDHNHIQGNNITNCDITGIRLDNSDNNVIFDNYVKGNGMDLVWDGYGDNLWMRNEFDTVSDTDIIDSNEAARRDLEEQLEEVDAEKESLQEELESASTVLSDLESELEEASTSMSSLEDELSSVHSDIDVLQDQVESLEDEVASRLTYTTSGIIAIIAAIIFGVIGFLAAKRT